MFIKHTLLKSWGSKGQDTVVYPGMGLNQDAKCVQGREIGKLTVGRPLELHHPHSNASQINNCFQPHTTSGSSSLIKPQVLTKHKHLTTMSRVLTEPNQVTQ